MLNYHWHQRHAGTFMYIEQIYKILYANTYVTDISRVIFEMKEKETSR